MKVRSPDLAVVVFENNTQTVKRLHDIASADEVVEQALSQPALGYTNLADALERGWREARRARPQTATGLLITDGVYTVGGNPLAQAARFARLFVLLTEDESMNPSLCEQMARAGKGEVLRVQSYDDLPNKIVDIANRVLR